MIKVAPPRPACRSRFALSLMRGDRVLSTYGTDRAEGALERIERYRNAVASLSGVDLLIQADEAALGELAQLEVFQEGDLLQ